MFEISSACQRLMRIYRLSERDVRSICVELDRESPVSIGHGVAFTVTEKALGRRRFLAIVDHAKDQGASVLRVVLRVPDSSPSHGTPIETLAALCDTYAGSRTRSGYGQRAIDGFRP